MAEKGKITKKLATEAVEMVLSTIREALVNGDEITVHGLGNIMDTATRSGGNSGLMLIR